MIKIKLTTLALSFLTLILVTSCSSSSQRKTLSPEATADLIETGKKITAQSFKALSGELMKALQENGVQGAVAYCHLQANPIIDSLSLAYNAKISRVSDRSRNPQNNPGELDITMLENYQKQHAEGLVLQPHLEITSNEIVFYAPILIQNPACLLCHGEPGITLDEEDYTFINSKYPDDKAIGYKLGDLRGLWRIVMNPELD